MSVLLFICTSIFYLAFWENPLPVANITLPYKVNTGMRGTQGEVKYAHLVLHANN